MNYQIADSIQTEASDVHKVPSGESFPTLDGLRAIAVLSVAIHHSFYFNLGSMVGRVLYASIRGGWMGVPIFFVLSGFLISYSVFKAGAGFDWRAYSVRRIAKIIPPFYLSILVFACLLWFFHNPPNLLSSVANDAMFGSSFSTPDVEPVYWTLYIEMHFYLTLPLVYLACRRFTRYPEIAIFLIFLIVPPAVRWSGDPSLAFYPRSLDNFSLGILFSIFYMNRGHICSIAKWAWILAPLGLVLLIVVYVAYSLLELEFQIVRIPYWYRFEVIRFIPEFATFLLLFSIFIPRTAWLYRMLTLPPLVLIGLVSYEWYLFHSIGGVLSPLWGQAGGNPFVYLGKTLLPFVASFGISCLVYFYYSAPILFGAKNRLRSKAFSGVRTDQLT